MPASNCSLLLSSLTRTFGVITSLRKYPQEQLECFISCWYDDTERLVALNKFCIQPYALHTYWLTCKCCVTYLITPREPRTDPQWRIQGGGPQGAMAPPNGLKKKNFFTLLKKIVKKIFFTLLFKLHKLPPPSNSNPRPHRLPPSKWGGGGNSINYPPSNSRNLIDYPPLEIGPENSINYPPVEFTAGTEIGNSPPQIQFLDPPLRTRVIVGSMNMRNVSDTTQNLNSQPVPSQARVPIPLGRSDRQTYSRLEACSCPKDSKNLCHMIFLKMANNVFSIKIKIHKFKRQKEF